jgi:ribosomal protein L44E
VPACHDAAQAARRSALRSAHARRPRFTQQAKTTKKIVLRLQCATCKFTHQHAIKARLKHLCALQP